MCDGRIVTDMYSKMHYILDSLKIPGNHLPKVCG